MVKKAFIFVITALLAMNFMAEDFYKNPGELQNFWHLSRNFYRRGVAKEAQLQQLNPAWKIEKLWQVQEKQKIYTSTVDDKGEVRQPEQYLFSGLRNPYIAAFGRQQSIPVNAHRYKHTQTITAAITQFRQTPA